MANSSVVDSQQSQASDNVHGDAEPVGDRRPLVLGDQLAPEAPHGRKVEAYGGLQEEEAEVGGRPHARIGTRGRRQGSHRRAPAEHRDRLLKQVLRGLFWNDNLVWSESNSSKSTAHEV